MLRDPVPLGRVADQLLFGLKVVVSVPLLGLIGVMLHVLVAEQRLAALLGVGVFLGMFALMWGYKQLRRWTPPPWLMAVVFVALSAVLGGFAHDIAVGDLPPSPTCSGRRPLFCVLQRELDALGGPLLAAMPLTLMSAACLGVAVAIVVRVRRRSAPWQRRRPGRR